jgi:toxin FitB
MVSYIVDTNIVSDIHRKSKLPSDWMAGVDPAQIYFSVVTISELEKGIVMKRRKDPGKANALAAWLARFRVIHEERFLPIDDAVAEMSGRFLASRTRDVHDCQVAATAHVHGLTVVTRNVADFADLPVSVLNPWAPTA